MTARARPSATGIFVPDDDRPRDELSPDVVKSLHADALRLKRGELIFVIPAFILGLFGATLIVVSPRQAASVGHLTGAALLAVGKWTADWYRLKTMPPDVYFRTTE